MTTSFVPVLSGDAALLLPRDIASVRPPETAGWPDELLLGLPSESIAHADDETVVEALNAHRRARCRRAANEIRLLARLDRLRDGDRYVGDEAGLEMRISRHAADVRVEQAVRLVRNLPSVLAAMDDGEIDGDTAGRIADAADTLSTEDRAVLNEWLADRYAHDELKLADPAALLRQIKRMVQRIDPDTAAARARKARRARSVQLVPGQDSMSTLIAELPAEIAASAYTRIDATARRLRNNSDPRTLDQLRADVFADLLIHSGHTTAGQARGDDGESANCDQPTPPTAMVYVHVPVGTALGITDDGAELAGYGPLPGPIARDILSRPNSVLRKVLEDPTTGKITGLGRHRRRPNALLRDAIRVRDRECAHCHRPATSCDLDHQAEWVRDRGPTDPDNMCPRCEHHHNLKDHPNWTLEFDPDTGNAVITTPAGRQHTRRRQPLTQPPDPPPQPNIALPDDPPFRAESGCASTRGTALRSAHCAHDVEVGEAVDAAHEHGALPGSLAGVGPADWAAGR